MNFLRIATGSGCGHSLGGFQHHAVKFTQGASCFFALGGFALESVVNRLAKSVPQLLLLLALNRHLLGLMLPALLHGLDGVDAQLRLGAQGLRLFDHGAAARQAVVAGSGQRRIGGVHGGFPLGLNLGKGFFTQVAGLAPLVHKAVEATDMVLPVGVGLVGFGPGQHFVNQHAPLGLGGFGLFLGFFQPGLDHFMGFVAGVVKTFPQRVVGRAALVAGFPLLAHGAQRFLLLAPAQRLGQQRFGFFDQVFTDLIGAPALPAFELSGDGQGRMGGCFQRVRNIAHMHFESGAQVGGSLGGGFAVAFGDFGFELGERSLHGFGGLGAEFGQDCRVQLHLGCAGRFVAGDSARLGILATRAAQFVGPHRHGRQWGAGIFRGRHRHRQSGLKSLPDGQQLGARILNQRQKLGVHTGPDRVLCEF